MRHLAKLADLLDKAGEFELADEVDSVIKSAQVAGADTEVSTLVNLLMSQSAKMSSDIAQAKKLTNMKLNMDQRAYLEKLEKQIAQLNMALEAFRAGRIK